MYFYYFLYDSYPTTSVKLPYTVLWYAAILCVWLSWLLSFVGVKWSPTFTPLRVANAGANRYCRFPCRHSAHSSSLPHSLLFLPPSTSPPRGLTLFSSPFSSLRTYDISKAKKELGYRPVVSLEEGKRRTLQYFKQQRAEGKI